MSKQFEKGAPNAVSRCPYCHGSCELSMELTTCQGCLAPHHQDCWSELGRCATCGLGTEAAETGASRSSPPGESCGSCGSRGSMDYDCPECGNAVCRGCHEPRFRRCVGCAESLFQDEVELNAARAQLKSRESGVVLSVVAVMFFLGTCAAFLRLGGFNHFSLLSLGAALFFGFVAQSYRRGQEQMRADVLALERRLAPFQLGFADRVVDGLRRVKDGLRERR